MDDLEHDSELKLIMLAPTSKEGRKEHKPKLTQEELLFRRMASRVAYFQMNKQKVR